MEAVRHARKQYGRRKRNRQVGLLLRGCIRLRAGLPLVINLPADSYTELAVKSGTAGPARLPQHMHSWFCLVYCWPLIWWSLLVILLYQMLALFLQGVQKPSLFSCLHSTQEMQQMLRLENEGRRMEMVGCAYAVSDGSGQSLQHPSAGIGIPGRGLLGGRQMLLSC